MKIKDITLDTRIFIKNAVHKVNYVSVDKDAMVLRALIDDKGAACAQ